MKKQILIGNDKNCSGKLLSKKLMSFGYMCDYARNRCDILRKRLSKKNYECIFLFVPSDDSRVCDFLREIKNLNENILIVTAIYSCDDLLYNKLISCGADRCVVSPSPDDICTAVIDVVTKNDRKFFRPEIAEFLAEVKFPRYLSGFYYLCTAIEICVEKQLYDKIPTMNLYKEIAEKMNVKPLCVERSLRHFSRVSFYRNSVSRALKVKNMGTIKNSELILRTTVMFAEKYGFISENNQTFKKII